MQDTHNGSDNLSAEQDQEVVEYQEGALANVGVQRDELISAMRNSLDVLAMVAMPDAYKYAFPPLFLALFAIVCEKLALVRDFSRYAVGLPRGFAKTTVVKLLMLWAILFSRKRFILILAKTEDHGCNILRDIMGFLYDPNMMGIFGDVRDTLERDRADCKIFTIAGREVIIAAVGEGGSVRGLNLGHARPDVILFDDIQDRDDADSETVSERLYTWMIGTAMKAKDPEGCLYLFLANMYPTPHSILKRLMEDEFWEKFVTGAILVNPEDNSLYSIWEDLQPLEQLLKEWEADKSAGREDIFLAEVQNDPNANVNTKFDPALMKHPRMDGIPLGNFIVIDPATQKERADEVTITYAEVHEGQTPCAMQIVSKQMDPKENIKIALGIAIAKNCSLIFVEATAYQATLKFWFEYFIKELGIEGIDVIELFPKRMSKNIRIIRMFPLLQSGAIGVAKACLTAVLNEAQAFNPTKTNNTDGILDTLVYMTPIMEKYSELILERGIIRAQILDADRLLASPDIELDLAPI